MREARILVGDVRERLRELPEQSVQCCVTSPPYWGLRDYGVGGQLGLERTPQEYVAAMVEVFREVWRVLRDGGTCWINLGDSYASGGTGGCSPKSTLNGGKGVGDGEKLRLMDQKPRAIPHGMKPKDLCGIPWRVAFALQAEGWYLRSDIIWSKPNPMPESVTDRPTKAHEYIFLLTKGERYYYDADAIKEPYAPDSFARYQYAFGGAKAETLTAEEAHGAGTRTHPIGMREYKGQATKDYDAAGAQNPSDTKRRILESMESGAGRNKRTVWTVTTQPYPEAHFATYPEALIEPCILAGSRVDDTVLDPFCGSGTTGVVACRHNRHFVGVELNPQYAALAEKRILGDAGLLNRVEVA